MLREEDVITGEEQEEEEREEEVKKREEPARREIRDKQEDDSRSRKLNIAPVESAIFQHSAELQRLPPMTVLKPPHDIQYRQQDSTTMHCCVKSEGCPDENEDYLLLEESTTMHCCVKSEGCP